MFSPIERMKTLHVSDVMSRQPIEVSANQTMCAAAKAFSENDVSSAPVVNEQGHCVGMLSAADFVKRDRPQSSGLNRHELATRESDHCFNIEPISDLVSRYMSLCVQSVSAETSLLQAAREMAGAHIHHLPVLENERPIGVLSTMDIVAAMINIVDEADACRNG